MSETPDIQPGAAPTEQSLREQAIAWHVRLSSDAAVEGDWLAFEAWLGEAPAHLEAYEAVEAFWSELSDLPAPIEAAGNVTPLRRRPARAPIAAWATGLAASLVVVAAAGYGLTDIGAPAQTYRTGHGERRDVALADGSHVILNGDSTLTVRLGRRTRRVEMAQAQAVFDVAKDPSRPFLITAGERQVRVVGTRFNVLNRDGAVQVTVQRGIVEVRPSATPKAPPLARLTAGQTLSHAPGAARDTVGRTDPETALAWVDGRLVFRQQRLADVVEALNRYATTPIVVADDARDLPVTATLVIDRDEVMAQRLCEFLPLSLERRGGVLRLVRRSEG